MAEGATSGLRRTVLFAFDGVLIRGDAFSLFMRDRYARARWRKALALLSSPWLLLVLLFSRRLPLRALVHIGLLGWTSCVIGSWQLDSPRRWCAGRAVAAVEGCGRCADTRLPAIAS